MHPLLRWTFIIYFVTHIPITICVDLQGLLGPIYPKPLTDMFAWYLSTLNDKLMTPPQPTWLKSFLLAELLFQMPFFFVAAYGLIFKKNWIRIPSIIYGSHVATTVWPIIAETLYSTQITATESYLLVALYSPYFIIPFLLAAYCALTPVPFPSTSTKTDKKR